MSKCWQRLAQRRVKEVGQGIMQAISQIYGRIKLAKEIPFIDELYLYNLKIGKSVEHKKLF